MFLTLVILSLPDDGKLSLDEFQAFFSDGTLNEEELEKLFHSIDSDNTNNVDTNELCDYFASHMGDYEEVLASLETLNLSILKAMDYTKRKFPIVSHKSGIKHSESMVNNRHYQNKGGHHVSEARYENPVHEYPPNNRVTAREQKRNIQTGNGAAFSSCSVSTIHYSLTHPAATSQCSRSRELESLYLVRQEMSVSQKHLGEFCEALKQYMKNVSAQRDCFHVTAVRLPDGITFVVYEFWEGEEEWKRHLQSSPCKVFQHVKVDTLTQPESVSSVAVPDDDDDDEG
ncbi:UNVERIFIED_CONTAM: hypothetical protein FKN15_064355 [Acipenser sinensis]